MAFLLLKLSARFKKSASAEDEAAILRAWGVDPSAL